MAGIKSRIQESVKSAMKARDKARLDAARLLLSALQYEEMQRKVDELPDEVSTSILQREVNRRKEELEFAEKAGRKDALEAVTLEIKFIEEFLPQQLSGEQLEKIILEMKSRDPALNMGGVMKALKESYAGQYDGKAASEIAKRVLS
ncbi:MAG: GatB/YqeY domain-containing protein [Deltaproteobacteria bacterium]|nr:GatB/YqeY domain-containing protein [Deltaproteobacteria bacterium]